MLLAASLAFLPLAFAQDAKPPTPPEITCVVVDRPRHDGDDPARWEKGWLERPRLVVLRDGTFLASVERIGHNWECEGVSVCRSTDRGAHWIRASTLTGIAGTDLLADADALYLMGTLDSQTSSPVIQRSTDHGETWSRPRNAVTGYISAVELDSVDAPSIVSGGRIWRLFTQAGGAATPATCDCAIVASAALGDDLLHAESWRWTNALPLDFLGGGVGRASRLAADGASAPGVILCSGRDAKGGASLDAKGLELKRHDSQDRPSSCDVLGLRLEHDSQSHSYFALAAFPDSTRAPIPPATLASEVSLLASRDLAAWDLRTVLLRGDPSAKFTCADWLIDGEDLVAVVGGELTEAGHERALLFLRVPKFRERKFGDAPASVGAGGK